tara:strand:- start:2966 stop:3859 length:894 start_codon:yes stop_codon:yes gene_type:complete
MAIRRVTGAVSPSELIFADANALGATYDGSGTTIERGETFTLPAGGTTAVSNGALRLEALKGDCTITNNGNSTLTNASGVDGTILMRSGASDFPAFVRNSSMGSMSIPAREDFIGSLINAGTFDGTINSNATFPAGTVLQVVTNISNVEYADNLGTTLWKYDELDTSITLRQANSKILVHFNFGSVAFGNSNLGYAKARYKLGSGSYTDITPLGSHTTEGIKHHMAVNLYDANYQSDVASMTLPLEFDSIAKDTVITCSVWFYGESSTADFFINRNARNSADDFATVSTCTLMEIAT